VDTRILPTSFDTHNPGTVGMQGQAVPICGAHDRPRRVVVEVVGEGRVFIGRAAQPLEVPGATVPSASYALAFGGPHIIAIGPKQTLFAVTDTPGTLLSAAVNDALVASFKTAEFERAIQRIRPTEFDTQALPPAQAGFKFPIANKGERAKRVVLNFSAVGAALFVSRMALAAAPEYTMPATGPHVFILAPMQEMFVRLSNPGGDTAFVSSIVSEIPFEAYVGPTGIPGPDGQE